MKTSRQMLLGITISFTILLLLTITWSSTVAGNAISAPIQQELPNGTPQPQGPPINEIYTLKRSGSIAHFLTASQALTNTPDLDVQYIGRTPRYAWCDERPPNANCTNVKIAPTAGDIVTFEGHIANRGDIPTGTFGYVWLIDGVQQVQSTHNSLNAGQEEILTYQWSWANGPHTVKLIVDTAAAISEISELNNSIEDRTDALSIGIYVEPAAYDFFNTNVWQANVGTNSFEDWIQRDVQIWNQMFAQAIFPLTPYGITDRVRLDKVVRLPSNGATHCDTNNPASFIVANNGSGIDYDVDLIWGFPSDLVGIEMDTIPNCQNYGPLYNLLPNRYLLDHDPGLIHELNHARYLVDLYGFNVDASYASLATSVNAGDTSFQLTKSPINVAWDPTAFPTLYPVIDGEISVCTQFTDTYKLLQCTRGISTTLALPHNQGASVFGSPMHLVDGQQRALAGSIALPIVEGRFFYQNDCIEQDIMSETAVERYCEYSAYAWNRIAGHRAAQGNVNFPGNGGEYLDEIPQSNIIELRRADGTLVPHAFISVYRPVYSPLDGFYGKAYEEMPAFTVVTNQQGQANLGTQPFGNKVNWDLRDAVLALKICMYDSMSVEFLPITRMNLAKWRGMEPALYPITITHTIAVPPLKSMYLPVVVKDAALLNVRRSTNQQMTDAYPPPETPTPTTSPYPAPSTPTPIPLSFPATSILDTFNRADGFVGNTWIGNAVGYPIVSFTLHNQGGNSSMLLWNAAFEANQEAFMSLPMIDSSAQEIDLILKAQDTSECNLLEVWYQPARGTAQVWTCHNWGTWTQHGTDIPLTLNAGDQFGARALADGTVIIYKNSTAVGSVIIDSSWPYRTDNGRIGIWLINAVDTVVDDIGGGMLP